MTDKLKIPRKLVLFEGCTTSRLLKSLRLSTYVLLDKAVDKGVLEGYQLIPNERCCGYASAGIGDYDGARDCMDYNIAQLNRIGIPDVLFTCGACTAYLGENPEFRRRGFRPINIMEYIYALIQTGELDRLVDRKLDPGFKITGHYSCHLRRTAGVRIDELYRTIVEYLGASYVKMTEPEACCGAGSEAETMTAIAERKVLDAGSTDADVCPLACAGCEALLKQVGPRKGVKTIFTSISALLVTCFSDLDKYLKKYRTVENES